MQLVRCTQGHTWTDTGQETAAVCPICGGQPTWDGAAGETRGVTPGPDAVKSRTVANLDQQTFGEAPKPAPASIDDTRTRYIDEEDATVDVDGRHAPNAAEPGEQTVGLADGKRESEGDQTAALEMGEPAHGNTFSEQPTIPAKGQSGGARQPPRSPTRMPVVPSKRDPLRGRTLVAGYQILGELGRGGMGVVYKARQPGANRLVALKMVLNSAHASKDALARFHIEAEAVAQLQHPNIVQLYEVGQEDGCPFFSLEFIDGPSLSSKIENVPQPAREAARLVQQLAEAMHFAHQRGIVHRDLKPANILLTKDGVPKITDFGLAKRLEDNGQGQTRTGAIMGTPSYMAPEQAHGLTKQSGPAADIYSLGAILYDMVTGRPPFRGTTVLETLQQVQTLEPVPPMRLQPSLPADLQTVCLKALEKDPQRRYRTAGELAEDLRRFQTDEPILARPTPWHERLWKWSKRCPAIASLIAVSALAAISLLIMGGLWLDSARRAADERATSAREQEELAKKNEREQLALRLVAERNFKRAKRAVDEMLSEVGQDRLRYLPQMEGVRRDLLKKAKLFYDEFIQESGSDPEIRWQAALAQQRVADILERLGDSTQALKAYESAHGMLAKLAGESPGEDRYQQYLAAVASNQGNLLKDLRRNREAEAQYRQALAARLRLHENKPGDADFALELAKSHNNLGHLLYVQGRGGEAKVEFGASRSVLEALAVPDARISVRAELARTLNNLGSLHKALGKAEAAESDLRSGQRILRELHAQEPEVPEHRQELASNLALWANLVRDIDASKAEQQYRESIALREQLSVDFPSTPIYAQQLARAYADLAVLLQATGKQQAADGAYEQALKLQSKLVDEFPHFPEFRRNLANSLNDRGVVLLSSGRAKVGEAALAKATDLLGALASKYPDTPEYTLELARTYGNMAAAWQQVGQPGKALNAARQALALHAKLASSYPTTPEYQEELASNEGNLGLLLMAQNPQEAKSLFAHAVTAFTNLANTDPANPGYRHQRAVARGNLARALHLLKAPAEAESEWRSALDDYHLLVRDFADVPGYAVELGKCYNDLGILLAGLKRFADAEKAWQGGSAVQAELLAKNPESIEYRAALGRSENNLGVLLLQAGDEARAEKQYRKTIAFLEEVEPKVAVTPALPGYFGELIQAHVNLANLLSAQRKLGDAEKHWLRVVDLREKLILSFPSEPRFRLEAVATLSELGNRAQQNDKFAEAKTLYAKAVEHLRDLTKEPAAAPELWTGLYALRLNLASSLVALKDHAAAAKVIGDLPAQTRPKDRQDHVAAVLLARCAKLAGDEEHTQKYADQAVALLRQSVANGFRDAAFVQNNEDLRTLEGRADFQELLKRLQTTPP